MITLFHTEAWGNVCWNIGVTLLISKGYSNKLELSCIKKWTEILIDQIDILPLVFFNEMKVIPSNNDGPHHLCTVASTSKYAASDRNSTSEWAFLINVSPCKCDTKVLFVKKSHPAINLNQASYDILTSKFQIQFSSTE